MIYNIRQRIISEPFPELHKRKNEILSLIDNAPDKEIESYDYGQTSDHQSNITVSPISKLDWFQATNFERAWVKIVKPMIQSGLVVPCNISKQISNTVCSLTNTAGNNFDNLDEQVIINYKVKGKSKRLRYRYRYFLYLRLSSISYTCAWSYYAAANMKFSTTPQAQGSHSTHVYPKKYTSSSLCGL